MSKAYENQNGPVRSWLGKVLGFDRQISHLKQRVRELEWDTAFGMWTRAAFLQLCRMMPRGQRTIAFLDLDDIHGLNHAVGYAEVDRRVRKIFSIQLRSSDIVARWYSGDEIVILFDSDISGARAKIDELRNRARAEGLDFVWNVGAWDVGRQDVVEVVDALAGETRTERPVAQKGRKNRATQE